MARLTGHRAAVNGVTCARDFTIHTAEAADTAAYCSSSDAGPVRALGNRDWQGVYRAYGHTPAILPGDLFRFQAALRNNAGFRSAENGAIGARAKIEWHIERGEFISHDVAFQGNGAFEIGAFPTPDGGIPAPSPTKGLGLTLDGVKVPQVTYMKLTLECKNGQGVDSDSDGWVVRAPGNFDAEIAYRLYIDSLALAALVDNTYKFNLFVDGAASWEVQWAKIVSAMPLVDIEGGEDGVGRFVHGEVTARMTGFCNGAKGHVKTPAGAKWWPPAA